MGGIENLPKSIGRYEIKALLGSGAMGSVYLAEDPRIKRKLAIKVVKFDAIRTEADRQEVLARFQREAEVSGVLNDPGIVTIYDVGDSEVGPFLAMEYVPGKTLESILKSGSPLPLKVKLSMAVALAAALDHAHSQNVVHRDVKPGNIMITADNHPKLMDFGIAKREDASLTQTGTFLGTPSYASPEQIREGVATGQSDVFSFGVMIFELLSGSLPFPGNSINTILYRIVNEPPVDIIPPVEGLVHDGWQKVFNKVLAKNPADRQGSCSAFVRELLDSTTDLGKTERMQLLGSLRPGTAGPASAPAIPETAVSQTSTVPSPVRPGAGRSRRLAIAGFAAVVILAGIVLARRGRALPAGASLAALETAKDAPSALPAERSGAQAPAQGSEAKAPAQGSEAKAPVQGSEAKASAERSEAKASVPPPAVAPEPAAKAVDPNAPGSLHFSGEYSVRARLDGKDLGELRPGASVPAAPGAHHLELSSPGLFFKETRQVVIVARKALPVALPGLVHLTVETYPASAMVLVDGILTQVESDGSTPITLTKGRHTVTIQGHSGVSKPVDLQADTPLKFKL